LDDFLRPTISAHDALWGMPISGSGIVSLDFDGVTTLWKIVCNAIIEDCLQ